MAKILFLLMGGKSSLTLRAFAELARVGAHGKWRGKGRGSFLKGKAGKIYQLKCAKGEDKRIKKEALFAALKAN